MQNAVARLFGGVSKYDSVTPVLHDVLHWLPIKEQINFKIEVLIYKALNGLAPSYLSEMFGAYCSQSSSTSKQAPCGFGVSRIEPLSSPACREWRLMVASRELPAGALPLVVKVENPRTT